MPEWPFSLVVIGFVAAGIGANFAVYTRARRKRQTWASANGYTIVSAWVRWTRTGPSPAVDRSRVIYRVRLEGGDGNQSLGWISCGIWRWRHTVDFEPDDCIPGSRLVSDMHRVAALDPRLRTTMLCCMNDTTFRYRHGKGGCEHPPYVFITGRD
jgi:hypothetical protein